MTITRDEMYLKITKEASPGDDLRSIHSLSVMGTDERAGPVGLVGTNRFGGGNF